MINSRIYDVTVIAKPKAMGKDKKVVWEKLMNARIVYLTLFVHDNGVRLVASATPLGVLRTVEAKGIRGLSKADRKIYAPPAGSGFV
ncbi:hypothetical protein F0562_026220 [Nyssa sinensis]|uniref:Uncharacterized protein n=1 Tax=Nyssa sinensis TaxID=561372 RepID=A0A5J5BA68_9ASTE|nr:hypothetical protein F0562_026220 [Nyssa sinensis]